MSHIVKFLRAEWEGRHELHSHNELYMADLCRRAADEIERLDTSRQCPTCRGRGAEWLGDEDRGGGNYESVYDRCSECEGSGTVTLNGEMVITWSVVVNDGCDPGDDQAPTHPCNFQWMRKAKATADGRRVILCNDQTGEIWEVDPEPGVNWMPPPPLS